jgi:FtsZ-interacting cell division protein ZipA
VRAILIFVVVVAVLVGGLLTLRSTRGAGMPGKDVMDRASRRAREQASKDDEEPPHGV